MARYILYGAGGVGCLIGGQLHLAGHDVTLIGRGAHQQALRERGLTFRTGGAEHSLTLPVANDISELDLHPEDTVVLAMKTQDTAPALDRLAAAAPPDISVVCAQNGVESERLALRLFDHVYGAFVFVFAAINAPGIVSCYTWPRMGIIDIGAYPAGSDQRAAALAADLAAAGFESAVRDDVMRWKRGKLLINLGNVVGAACPPGNQPEDIIQEARQEAERCFRAAGLDHVSPEDLLSRGRAALAVVKIDDGPFPGGSTTQGLARGNDTSEVDYLNGEIALLGRLFGVETPINASLQQIMRGMIKSRSTPGSMSPDALRRLVGQ